MKQGDWISVKDRLPELCCDAGNWIFKKSTKTILI